MFQQYPFVVLLLTRGIFQRKYLETEGQEKPFVQGRWDRSDRPGTPPKDFQLGS